MKTPANSDALELQVRQADADAVYPLEAVADLAGVSRRTILLYCRHGLMAPTTSPDSEGWYFNEQALHTLRLIERLRVTSGANFSGLKFMLQLMDEVEHLRANLRFRG